MGDKSLPNKIADLYSDNNTYEFDVEFKIENDNSMYFGHKFIIGLGSPELHAMAYGTKDLPATQVIHIPNCSSEAFQNVLKYLYTDAIQLNLNILDDVFRVANYLGLTKLEDSCIGYVDFGNVLDIYKKYFPIKNKFCAVSIRIIQLMLKQLLENDQQMTKFFSLPMVSLRYILQLDDLAIDERELFKVIMKWVHDTASSLQLEIDDDELLPKFEKVMKCIRFDDMKLKELSKWQTFLYDVTNINPRWIIRTHHFDKADYRIRLVPVTKETIFVDARRSIRIHGFRILKNMLRMDEKIYDWDNDVIIEYTYLSVDQSNLIDVVFEKPVEVDANSMLLLQIPLNSDAIGYYKHYRNDNFEVYSFGCDFISINSMFVSST